MAENPKASDDKQKPEEKAKSDTGKKDLGNGAKPPKAPSDKADEKKAKIIDFTPNGKNKSAEAGAKAKETEEEKAEEEKPPEKEETPQQPSKAPRSDTVEQIVYLKPSDLHAFKNHPFEVREDNEMRAMVESVKDKGVTQPLIVRPLEEGGFEIISGHRRQKASELAGFENVPCIVRDMTDDEAITQMVEDNTTQRENILPSERGKALAMQLEAIKHQGKKNSAKLDPKEVGMRSNEIVAARNNMTSSNVKRYIRLNSLIPDLLKLVDDNTLKLKQAVDISYIKPKNQQYIFSVISSEQITPGTGQTSRMKELDKGGFLNKDSIDGIMMEDKGKEENKVILTGAELSEFFTKDKTPKEMKEIILGVMAEWKEKQPPKMDKENKGKQQPEK